MDKRNVSAADVAAYTTAGGTITKCPPTSGLKQTAEEAAELEAHRERQWQLRKEHNFAQRDDGAFSKRGRPADAPVLIHSLPPPRAPVTSPKQAKARAAKLETAPLLVPEPAILTSQAAARAPKTRKKAQPEPRDRVAQVKGKSGRPRTSAEKWAEIIAEIEANPNASAVARKVGTSRMTVWRVAQRAGIELTGKAAAASENMKHRHADPEFAAKLTAAASENMKRLRADPEFAAKLTAAASENMKRLNADPEFQKKRIAGIRRRAAANQPIVPARSASPAPKVAQSDILESAAKSPQNARAVCEEEIGRAGAKDCFRGCGPGCGILAAPDYAGCSRFLHLVSAARVSRLRHLNPGRDAHY